MGIPASHASMPSSNFQSHAIAHRLETVAAFPQLARAGGAVFVGGLAGDIGGGAVGAMMGAAAYFLVVGPIGSIAGWISGGTRGAVLGHILD